MDWDQSLPNEKFENISVEEMDRQVKELASLDAQKKTVEKMLEDITSKCEVQKQILFNILKKSGKDKYLLSGVGTVSIMKEKGFQTPKTNEDKEKFFNWVQEKHGRDFLLAKQSFNSKSLNAFLKAEYEAEIEKGNTVFKVPGIMDATTYEKIKFNKAKTKSK